MITCYKEMEIDLPVFQLQLTICRIESHIDTHPAKHNHQSSSNMHPRHDDYFAEPHWPSEAYPTSQKEHSFPFEKDSSSHSQLPFQEAEPFQQSISKESINEDNVQNTTFASVRVKVEELLDNSFHSYYAFDPNNSFKTEKEIKEEEECLEIDTPLEEQSSNRSYSQFQPELYSISHSEHSIKQDYGIIHSEDQEAPHRPDTLFTLKSSNPKKRYKILNSRLKEYLVEQTNYHSMTKVSKMYGVSINNLCRWKRSTQRKSGAGRKVNNRALEKKLLSWLGRLLKNNQGHTLTKKMIQQKAKFWSNDESFKASKGWLERFVKRNRHLNLHILLKMQLKNLLPYSDESVHISSTNIQQQDISLRRSSRNNPKKEHQSIVKKQDYE